MAPERFRMKMFTAATAAATRDVSKRRSAFAVNRSKSASEMGSAALNTARRKCKIVVSNNHNSIGLSASSHNHSHITMTPSGVGLGFGYASEYSTNQTALSKLDALSNTNISVSAAEYSGGRGTSSHLSIPIRTASLSHSNLDTLSPIGSGRMSGSRSSNDWSAISRLSASDERDDVDVYGKRCAGRRRHYDQNGSVVDIYSPKRRFIHAVNQIRLENNVLQAFNDVNLQCPQTSLSSDQSAMPLSSSTSPTLAGKNELNLVENRSVQNTNLVPMPAALASSDDNTNHVNHTKRRFNALMRIKMFAIKRQNRQKFDLKDSHSLSKNQSLSSSFDK